MNLNDRFNHEGGSTGSSGKWLYVLHDRRQAKQEEILEGGFTEAPPYPMKRPSILSRVKAVKRT